MTTEYECPACGSSECSIYRHRGRDPWCPRCQAFRPSAARASVVAETLAFFCGAVVLLVVLAWVVVMF